MFLTTQLHPGTLKTANHVLLVRRFFLVLIVCQSMLLTPKFVTAQDEALTRANQSGVLLLRNGQLLAGKYAPTGFGYELTLTGGGIIRLKTEQVEFVSDSLDEIYSFRRASKVNNTAAAHLEMANWCLTNRLYNHSAFHLREAIRMDPRQLGIKQIQARLAIAKSNPVYPARQPSRSPSNLVSNEEITNRVKQLEPEVVQTFSKQLQPLLLNKCAVSGCHGPNPRSKYQLITSRWSKTTPQNISFRNLYNSLLFINFSQPEQSPILTHATSAHGELKTALMSVRHNPEQLTRLVNWVRILTSGNRSSEKGNDDGRHLQSPLIFKADSVTRMVSGQFERVPIPSSEFEKGNTDPLNANIVTKPAGNITMNPFGDSHEHVTLSSDFDNLPLLTHNNGLLKVFQPPVAKTKDLTPNLDATFHFPSDFILKDRISRGK